MDGESESVSTTGDYESQVLLVSEVCYISAAGEISRSSENLCLGGLPAVR